MLGTLLTCSATVGGNNRSPPVGLIAARDACDRLSRQPTWRNCQASQEACQHDSLSARRSTRPCFAFSVRDRSSRVHQKDMLPFCCYWNGGGLAPQLYQTVGFRGCVDIARHDLLRLMYLIPSSRYPSGNSLPSCKGSLMTLFRELHIFSALAG